MKWSGSDGDVWGRMESEGLGGIGRDWDGLRWIEMDWDRLGSIGIEMD